MTLFPTDRYTVHTEIISMTPGMDSEIAVHSVEAPFGTQKHDGKKGCGYMTTLDEDFEKFLP